MRVLQLVNSGASLLATMAAFMMAEQLAIRKLKWASVAYMVVAGAYLCNAWNMLAVRYGGRVPWTAVLAHSSNAIALAGFAWYLRQNPEFL